jgi:Uma2 family endonuclease
MTLAVAKWTIDEYHRMIETGLLDNRRVELLRGEIIEMAPEGEPHAYFSTEAGVYLTRLLGELATVRPAKPITLFDGSEPEPDIAIVQPLGRQYLQHHPYPENIFWVIEYSNTSLEKDLEIKTEIYAEAGIDEYWVVNLRTRELIVFRNPQQIKYTSKSILTVGTVNPLAFPNIAVSVGAIIST